MNYAASSMASAKALHSQGTPEQGWSGGIARDLGAADLIKLVETGVINSKYRISGGKLKGPGDRVPQSSLGGFDK